MMFERTPSRRSLRSALGYPLAGGSAYDLAKPVPRPLLDFAACTFLIAGGMRALCH